MSSHADDALDLVAENERLREERDSYQRAGIRAMEELNQLKAEVTARRSQAIYWKCSPGIGLIRCVTDDQYRRFPPGIRMRYSPVLVETDEELWKDANRYRWFRDHSLQIVCASTGPWVHNLNKVIDEAMAKADVYDVPLMCSQRMAAAGLPHARSSCYSCGKFSPKWRECEAKIAAQIRKDDSE